MIGDIAESGGAARETATRRVAIGKRLYEHDRARACWRWPSWKAASTTRQLDYLARAEAVEDLATFPSPWDDKRLAAALALAVAPVRTDLDRLAWAVGDLREEIRTMSTAQDRVMADIAALKSEIGAIATTYQQATAAAIAEAVGKARTAWEADDEAGWSAAHDKLAELQALVAGGQPVTPPATESNPTPAAAIAPSAALAATPVAANGGANAGGGTADGTSGTGTTNTEGTGAGAGLGGGAAEQG